MLTVGGTHWGRSVYRDAEGVEYGELTEKLLNRLGAEGREMCGLVPRLIVLKRRVGGCGE